VPEEHPETVATAIRIGNPASGKKALRAVRETGGTVLDVTDAEILAAQTLLGRTEGVGVEPASAASIAGVLKMLNAGEIGKGETVACVCTGNALKDPDTIIKNSEGVLKAKADYDAVKRLVVS
jgi:threonine synthase